MKVNIKFQGQTLVAHIPNPAIGQFVSLAAGNTRIRLYWDGKRFVLPQAQTVDTAKIMAVAAQEEQKVAPRDLPSWVYEERDPRIVALRELAGPDYDAFIEARMAGAWQQGLLYQQMRAERKSRTGAGDDLEERLFQAYADHAASKKVAMATDAELAEMRGDRHIDYAQVKEIAEVYGVKPKTLIRYLLNDPTHNGSWNPNGEDIKLALELKGEEEWASNLASKEGERDDERGREIAEYIPDPISHLLAWAGRTDQGPGLAPLPTVLANIADQWGNMTPDQRELVKKVMPESQEWEEVVYRKERRHRVPVLHVHRRISTLWERSQMADVQAFIEEALDEWENRRAANDEEAHPDSDETKVEVSLDNQTRFLEWVAQGALSATAEVTDNIKADKVKKPWLGRPSYLVVLDAAIKSGANINQAKNRAYAADTLRLPDRVLAWTGTGFRVRLNGKGEEGVVSAEDARLAFPHLPAAAKARLKQVHGMRQ